MEKKVLIITYYYPPSGGAGVQRWLKLSNYLADLGVEVHLITVDPKYASYSPIDDSLIHEIDDRIQVYRTKTWEPIKLYQKLVGKKNVPTAGFTNVNQKSTFQKFMNALRSNLFIPDPRKGWVKYAVEKATEVIKSENIATVITSSPPHSTQLIGLKLKKRLGIKWICDLRDPWTDIYYYELLNHSSFSHKQNQKLEKTVLHDADHIVTVSSGVAELFKLKMKHDQRHKIQVIPNGYDPKDFEHFNQDIDSTDFVISYIGTMSDQYKVEPFLDAFDEFAKSNKNAMLRFVGNVSGSIQDYCQKLEILDHCEFVGSVSHLEAIKYLGKSNALLLVLPDVSNAKGIVTGKLFEYLAAKKPIICLGPKHSDASKIIQDCEMGQSFERDQIQDMTNYLKTLTLKGSVLDNSRNEKIEVFSRYNQAREFLDLI